MKTSTKTLLVSVLAIACSGGVYAQGAGAGSAGAGGAGGTGSGMGNGAAPSGNTLEQPGIQPGMNGGNTSTDDHSRSSMRSHRNTGGYGSPGATGRNSGRYSTSPGMNEGQPSDTTGNPANGQGQIDNGGHQ